MRDCPRYWDSLLSRNEYLITWHQIPRKQLFLAQLPLDILSNMKQWNVMKIILYFLLIALLPWSQQHHAEHGMAFYMFAVHVHCELFKLRLAVYLCWRKEQRNKNPKQSLTSTRNHCINFLWMSIWFFIHNRNIIIIIILSIFVPVRVSNLPKLC